MDPQLFALRRDYLALVPTNKLKFPEKISLTRLNGFFVNDILLDHHFQKYPPSDQYQIGFWKWAIQRLEELACHISEEEEEEIASPLYEYYVRLISRKTTSGTTPPAPSYVTYFWLPAKFDCVDMKTEVANMHDYFTATLLESRTTIEGGTTGLRTWLASFYLATYLIQNPDLVVSNSVLELGSGIGFLGIIVATLQQTSRGHNQPGTLWLTDVNDEVLERCRENLRLSCNPSSSHPSVHYNKLDWCSSLVNANTSHMITLIRDTIHPDLVIGADIVFDPTLIPGLVGTIKLCLETHARCALIAITIRNESTLACFLSHLRESLLHAEELALPLTHSFSHHTVDAFEGEGNVVIFRITK